MLRPGESVEVAAGSERRRYPGLGYCGATLDTRVQQRPQLECYIHEQQPAILVAQPIGAPGDGQIVAAPDYRPGFLRSLRDHDYAATLPQGAERIRLTSFDDVAHVSRRVEVDGVLGGSATACPPPA